MLASAFLITVIVQYEEIKSLKSAISTYQQQMIMLKLDSEKQAANTKQAYETAQEQMQRVRTETQAILRTKVSSNCEESIQWLIQQAHSL